MSIAHEELCCEWGKFKQTRLITIKARVCPTMCIETTPLLFPLLLYLSPSFSLSLSLSLSCPLPLSLFPSPSPSFPLLIYLSPSLLPPPPPPLCVCVLVSRSEEFHCIHTNIPYSWDSWQETFLKIRGTRGNRSWEVGMLCPHTHTGNWWLECSVWIVVKLNYSEASK